MSLFKGPLLQEGYRHIHQHTVTSQVLPWLSHISEAECTAEHVRDVHSHPVYEFVYVLSGRGERTSEGKTSELSAGDLYIVRPHEQHGGRANREDPYHFFTIAFDPDRLKDSGDIGLAVAEATALDSGKRVLDRRIIHGCGGAELIFRRILAELDRVERSKRGGALGTIMVQAQVIELLAFITRCAVAEEEPDATRGRAGRMRPEFSDLVEWIEGQLREPPTLTEMANRVDLSPAHFTVAFKRQVGQTPLEYVTSRRIDEAARQLIARPRDTITAIALDLGFSSSQYFSLVFRKQKGCTPREWRRRAE